MKKVEQKVMPFTTE